MFSAFSHAMSSTGQAISWLFHSKEYTNFTYDLDPLNREYLAAFVASVTRVPVETIRGYFSEILEDHELIEYLRKSIRHGPARAVSDDAPKFGRRIGWYAFVRATKPKVIVETGVDKGLGASVLTAALRRNARSGVVGKYYGTDINPEAGYLLGGPYAEFGEILYGDSIESLRKVSNPIDLFINDSDHSASYEDREYNVIESKLSSRSLVLSDNAHVTSSLLKFAERTGRDFLYFQEWPKNHWYPGSGIGVAFYPRA